MSIKINLKKNSGYHFEALNEEGHVVNIDASPDIGGKGKGVRPMQLLLMGLGGCGGIDIVNILNKQKQTIEDFEIFVEGEREKDVTPSLYKKIEIVFALKGKLDEDKVKRAVSLSVDKYCSVKATLDKTAEINYRIELNGKKI